MIHFHDIDEKASDIAPHTSDQYKEIKPEGSLQKKQAQDFWDSLFADDLNEPEPNEISEEEIFAEIFDRREEEFLFDFEIGDELQAELEKFDDNKWEALSETEQKALIEEFVGVLSQKLGLTESPTVRFFEGPENSCGAYRPADHSVEINSRIFSSPREVVDTLAHELRHAYQHQRADDPHTWTDLLYRYNFDNYITPIRLDGGAYLFFTDYQNQFVEAEARAFAKLFTSKGAIS